jgi:hypothetical protein
MDDTACQRFFGKPTQTFHRQYEALRAFFLEHRSLGDIAQRFGYSYHTVRSLVRDFRSQCQTGRSSPFSPLLGGGDWPRTTPLHSRPSEKKPPSPMSASWI